MSASARAGGGGTPAAATPQELEQEQRRRRRKAILLLFMLAGLLIVLLLFGWYLIFRQPINPIPPIPVSQLPHYATSIYDVTRPVGVAASKSGDRIYVTQGGAIAEALVLDASGKRVGTMTIPKASGDRQPVYIAVNPQNDEVWLTDRFTGGVYIYSKDGAYLRQFKPATDLTGLQPLALAFDSSGLVYMTELAMGRVVAFDKDGKMTRVLGADDRLNFPNGVAVAADGTVVVADSNNGRIVTFDKDGKMSVRVGRGAGQGSLGVPRGVWIDDKGRIFVVDTTGQQVNVYRDGGAKTFDYLGAFGAQGTGDGKFNFPSAIAMDTRARLYISDSFNDRIQLWQY